MLCLQYDKDMRNMEKGSPVKPSDLRVKNTASKDPLPLKPKCPATKKRVPFHDLTNTEGQTLETNERTLLRLEDSGYSSLYDSPINVNDDHPNSWSRCRRDTGSGFRVTLMQTSSMLSTTSEHHDNPNQPIQHAGCDELAKSYGKTKRYECRAISSNRQAAPAQKSAKRSRFEEFVQAASRLKPHQSLQRCTWCGSPAMPSDNGLRATCTSCQFDLCTRCRQTFHGFAPCQLLGSPSPSTSEDTNILSEKEHKWIMRRLYR
ncbi:uncharacterized protein LOC129194277 [Dunckerocampus dactyliophorus]|uniref:uncharacterized protein LOC129194277 n=1 Tax=Dunckerocampus dactyliophorus TaxID=161453 RepID=UPI002405F516|nr:uncharacterized protein LOC129194277 [Dunckerocampus dactyliophorus]